MEEMQKILLFVFPQQFVSSERSVFSHTLLFLSATLHMLLFSFCYLLIVLCLPFSSLFNGSQRRLWCRSNIKHLFFFQFFCAALSECIDPLNGLPTKDKYFVKTNQSFCLAIVFVLMSFRTITK